MKIKKIRWELAKKLKKGQPLTIKPTMICNLNCPYCAASFEKGRLPRYKQHDYKYWIKKITGLKGINQIGVSGGEPGLYKNFHKLINHLTEKGYVILIFTNLTTISEFEKINKTWRVRFIASYHEGASLEEWLYNYNRLKDKFHIIIRELRKKDDDRPGVIPGSQINELFDTSPEDYGWQFAPNGTEYYNCKQVSAGGN